MPVPDTNAYTIITLRGIDPQEPITVSYATDGSYFQDGHQCRCATCNPDAPPVATRRPIDYSKFVKRADGKRTRRGGKREKRRKNALERNRVEELQVPSENAQVEANAKI